MCVTLRYLGEEEDGSVSKETLSKALLAKLQKKAKEKQKRHSAKQREPLHEHPAEQVDAQKKRKADVDGGLEPQQHKKRHSETVASCSVESVEQTNIQHQEEIQSGGSFNYQCSHVM